jgi:phospholipase/carboxylesterase
VRFVERVTGGAGDEDTLPMIVAIHGLGDRPESFAGLFEGFPGRARIILPYGEPWQSGFAWWRPAGASLDPDRVASGSERAAHRLAAMIDELAKARPTAGKPLVTGFSQGGMVSFALAVLHPEVIGEAFPVSGLLAPALWPSSWPAGKATPPIFALHGTADPRVPIDLARKSVARLRELGFNAELQEYVDVGHTVIAEMRRDLFKRLEAAAARAAGR